ncbi:unnamed protein product, partial [Symbiodinium necroappetens]
LRKLSGWNCDMECADLLHTVWVGCAKDLVGSVLLDVVQYDPRLANSDSWDSGLAALLSLFHSWCETRKLDKSLVEELSLVKLGVTNAVQFDFPKGMSKAYPNKVLVYFLADLLQATTVPELKRQAVACWALANWSYVIDMAEVFLTDAEARQAVESAKLYLQCHMLLARLALVAGRPRYKIRLLQRMIMQLNAQVDDLQLVIGGWDDAKRGEIEQEVRELFSKIEASPLLLNIHVPFVRSRFARVELLFTSSSIAERRRIQTLTLEALKKALVDYTSAIQGQQAKRLWVTRNRSKEDREKIRALVSMKDYAKRYLDEGQIDLDWRGRLWLKGEQVLYWHVWKKPVDGSVMLTNAAGDETGWWVDSDQFAKLLNLPADQGSFSRAGLWVDPFGWVPPIFPISNAPYQDVIVMGLDANQDPLNSNPHFPALSRLQFLARHRGLEFNMHVGATWEDPSIPFDPDAFAKERTRLASEVSKATERLSHTLGGEDEAFRAFRTFYEAKYSRPQTEPDVSPDQQSAMFERHQNANTERITDEEIAEALSATKPSTSSGLDSVCYGAIASYHKGDSQGKLASFFTDILLGIWGKGAAAPLQGAESLLLFDHPDTPVSEKLALFQSYITSKWAWCAPFR